MSQEVDLESYEKEDDDMLMYDGNNIVEEVNDVSQSVRGKSPIASTLAPRKKIVSCSKGRALTSGVWNHMTKQTINGEVFAICNYCKKKLGGKSSNGTKHLHNHLKRCPKMGNRDIKQQLLQVKEKRQEGKVEYRTYSFDEKVSRNDLSNMIILHEYPLNIVNHVGFRTYSRNLQPLFKMVTRNTIRSDILKIYETKRAEIIKLLDALDSKVAITTDLWTAKPTKRGFMAITVHYIDASWVLQSRIVRFIHVPPPHTGEALTEVLVDALMALNLDRKVSTVTVDNASSNDSMMDKVVVRLDPSALLMGGRVAHMRCGGHILSLVVKDGLDVIRSELEKVRNSVVYWIASYSRIQRFEEAARQLSIPHVKKLVLDCPTRWNSTYVMLETALLYKKVFPRVSQIDRNYKCVPSEEDWSRVKEITEKLKIFYDATLLFSGTSYPTANVFFPKICDIKVELQKWLVSPHEYIQIMAQQMIEKYDKYWNVCNEILGVACVLDPRYKMKLVEYYAPLVHGDDNAHFHVERIKKSCYDLLNEYQSKACVEDDSVTLGASSCASGSNQNDNDPLLNFDKYVSSTSSNFLVKSEMDFYLEENVLPRSPNFDVLGWWKTNGVKFPTLQKIARDILAIPISSVASEAAFSTSGRLITPHRSRLAPNTLEALMCSQSWLRNENQAPLLEVDISGELGTCNDDAYDD